jgi:hypothetical protein
MGYRRHRKHFSKRNSKNIINKTINNSLSLVKSTSKKILPKVKYNIENVGSKVVKTGEQSIPFLQRTARRFFGMFSNKSNKSNKSKKHRRH